MDYDKAMERLKTAYKVISDWDKEYSGKTVGEWRKYTSCDHIYVYVRGKLEADISCDTYEGTQDLLYKYWDRKIKHIYEDSYVSPTWILLEL